MTDYRNNMLRMISSDGITAPLGGSTSGSTGFVAGVGPNVRFVSCADLLAHPTVDKFFYISDDAGVRIICK